jgi:nicotinate dehydrogenase subunit B
MRTSAPAVTARRKLNAWVRFHAPGKVMIATGKVEIGQGIVTAMAQIAAEELDISIARVHMVAGDTRLTPDEGVTSGSRSVSEGGRALRHACAQVRRMLLEEAARRLDASIDTLAVHDGVISPAAGGAGISYWDLPHAALLDVEDSGSATPKPAHRHTVSGTSVARLDIPAKVLGQPCFVQDLELPGMLFGRVVRPPVADARLTSFDADAVRRLPGVVAVVQDGSFLGVVAEREEQAIKARSAMQACAEWSASPLPTDDAQIYDFLLTRPSQENVILAGRQTQNGEQAARSFSACYKKPYIAHASIGPSCALARADRTQVEVWTHSQSVYPLREELARILDMPRENIVVHHAEGAGCYGHNGADDAALDAILLSRATGGRPVQVQWMREDEFAWEPYGPAMVVKTQAALDAQGRIIDWSLDAWSNGHLSRPGIVSGPDKTSSLIAAWHLEHALPRTPQVDPSMGKSGISHGGTGRNAAAIYDFPDQRVVAHCVEELPLRVSSLRAIGAYANIFAIESFIDELAHEAGEDPVEYRLQHMKDTRARAVIALAADKAGWHKARSKGSDGTTGMGIAFAQYSNHMGYLAIVVEVGIDPDFHVKRAVAAVDVGAVINPDGVINQTEGGIIQAISWTLKEQVRFNRDGVTSLGWPDYPILTFPEVPQIDVHLISRSDEEPLGAGEITMGPVAAAIANALHQALGVRIRELPITRERILAAADSL